MNVRRLEPSDADLVASIDRSEHVEVQYRIEGGRLVEAPVLMADIPAWDPDGSGEHSVASHIAFCRSVVADGAALFGAFDDDGEFMGLATVHPTFEPGLAWLATLHVSRAHRRRGAASALWDAGVALAREAGARSLYVSATPTGSAVGFYLGTGAGSPIPCTRTCSPTSPRTSPSCARWTPDRARAGLAVSGRRGRGTHARPSVRQHGADPRCARRRAVDHLAHVFHAPLRALPSPSRR